MRIGLTGSHGFIGSNLKKFLQHEIIPLSRPYQGSYDAIIHLAGTNLFKQRWTAKYKEELIRSRVETTKEIVANTTFQTLLVASAVGYYGDRGDEILDESSIPGDDFLANLCKEWEAASKCPARVCNMRFGMVLGKGGALEKMLPIFRMGLGGKIATGHQYISWIALEDLLRGVQFLLEHEEICGPINLVSPHPVLNEEFTKCLGGALHRPTFLKVPAWLVRLILGERASVLLSSQRVLPKKLESFGFSFKFSTLTQNIFFS